MLLQRVDTYKLIVVVDYLLIVNSTGTLIGNKAHRESYQTTLA
jgi:hypothetical protein